jgi:hypothetical protein
VLFLQELKSTEFPPAVFTEMGYESAAVTQKGYNGVAVLSLTPIETISTALSGDGDDIHARFLEMTIQGIFACGSHAGFFRRKHSSNQGSSLIPAQLVCLVPDQALPHKSIRIECRRCVGCLSTPAGTENCAPSA